MKPEITAARLREVLDYEPVTGVFTWLTASPKDKHRAGKPARGYTCSGQRYISVESHEYTAARLAWLHVTGEWPDRALRFVDGSPSNLAFDNLIAPEPRPPLTTLAGADARRRVLQLLDFDPDTGIFTSKTDRFEWQAGEAVGCRVGGYLLIGIDGAQLLAHRLAWLVVHGEWPHGVIDHKDGDRLNNRPENLRDTTQAVNVQNTRRARSDSVSGVQGVAYRKDTGRYDAHIRVNGRSLALGCYDTPEEAHAVYVKAKRALHEGCTL